MKAQIGQYSVPSRSRLPNQRFEFHNDHRDRCTCFQCVMNRLSAMPLGKIHSITGSQYLRTRQLEKQR